MRLRVSARACVPRQTHAVDLQLDQPGHDVVASVSRGERPLAFVDLLVDVLRELGERVGESLSPLGAVPERELALHQFLRQTGDAVGVVGREPEQMDSDTVRERHGERGDEVGTRRAVQLVEEVVGRRAHERLRFVDDRRRQRGDHHAPHERMLRGVELAEDAVLERDDDARCLHSRRVRERRGVAHDRTALRPARHVRQVAGDSGDGAARAQLPEQRPRVLAPAERIELGRLGHLGILTKGATSVSSRPDRGTIRVPEKGHRHGRSSRQAHRVPGRQRRRRAGRIDRTVERRRAGRRRARARRARGGQGPGLQPSRSSGRVRGRRDRARRARPDVRRARAARRRREPRPPAHGARGRAIRRAASSTPASRSRPSVTRLGRSSTRAWSATARSRAGRA